MKSKLLIGAMLLCGNIVFAQVDDPVVMKINGQPVSRSEFEYSFNKNNSEGVIDKKSVDEYVDLFVNYKLKVEAAKEARLDTLKSFLNEFAGYRDQQIRPAMITDADIEAEARRIYEETRSRIDGNGGMTKPAHILVMVKQKADEAQQKAAKERIDSIYNALQNGADFAELAKKCSDDKGTAANGGELQWIAKGMTLKEFEDAAWALEKGQMSKPVLSPAGWHIILLKDKGNFFDYDSQRADIVRYIEQRGLREKIIDNKLDSIGKAQNTTAEKVLEAKRLELEANDSDLRNLIKEYYDGLLLYEISNRTVWEKAAADEAGLVAYFKKNKKNYKWDAPRFKGIAYHVKDQADVKAVKDAVKGLPFDQWADKLRKTFNNDSILRIRVEKGIFKQGDNALVDREVFGVDTIAKGLKDYPIDAVYGQKLKAPKEMTDVKAQVLADYQDALEKEWVEGLRRKYAVEIDEEVLKTVNKH
ncbi:MAG: peptidylprolyl isomerase [Prevotella sp.]|nr:peptidylprolyl isomerase [Prevotella sp.]MCI6309210.1 peptidylprolyl isomerase [Prevotella sp.]MCI6463144.1 peptidylprolyl isomerase [Prevotella sp.]MCI6500927.1 peptidylprolyl isomerase [Prevotella sp.]MCI6555245.1 peptidylprolyl isomerase [Prevotella sp.]